MSLDDNNSLEYYQIKSGSFLQLVYNESEETQKVCKPISQNSAKEEKNIEEEIVNETLEAQETIQIFIDNYKTSISVSKNLLVSQLKESLRSKGLDVIGMRIVHNSKELEDDKTLNYYSVAGGDKLRVLNSMKGSGMNESKPSFHSMLI